MQGQLTEDNFNRVLKHIDDARQLIKEHEISDEQYRHLDPEITGLRSDGVVCNQRYLHNRVSR